MHCGINEALNRRIEGGETTLGLNLWIPFGEGGRVRFGSQGGARSSLTLGSDILLLRRRWFLSVARME
jgi:hypothetical protein